MTWRRRDGFQYVVTTEPKGNFSVPSLFFRVGAPQGTHDFFLSSEQAREWASALLKAANDAEHLFGLAEAARDSKDDFR